jgi:hypothetical protein
VQKQRFAGLLDEAAARGLRIPFWWRDDDAETATPALDRLLSVAGSHDVPLALAVVPKNATTALADRLAVEPRVSVLQHGWQHRNHAPEGEKKVELGDHRPPEEVVEELRLGFARISRLFPEKFAPVLVPPWNRISKAVGERRREVGLVGLSVFGPAPANEPHWVNVHLDIFEWQPTRRPVRRGEAYAILATELEKRIAGDPEPIGIMTHHLVHGDESWSLLSDVFSLTARHPAIIWPAVGELFALSTAGQVGS